jgi:glyoxylase-like metal-dependent hydrolase (beta-lactamase superfamily II)
MTTLTAGMAYADLEFQGLHRIIATVTLTGADGITVVDPGPTTTLPVLERHLSSIGAGVQDITALFITHIHLDHAGATGTLVQRNPRINVFVHEVGAPHMVDPSKLVASAGRLYGDDMERLWGAVTPVPAAALVVLKGGERLDRAGRAWEVAYTPGHASHHVSYFSPDSGIAFVGDTAGVQVLSGGFVLPPTPPPDIDLPAWAASLDAIERWRPQTLFLTHFGPSESVTAHLAELRDHMQFVERLTREALARSEDEAQREAWFTEQLRSEMRRRTSEADMRAYEMAGRFDLNWRGIARYVTKRAKNG